MARCSALARWLEAAGLEPGGDDRTFFQSFAVAAGMALATGNRLAVSTPAVTESSSNNRAPGSSIVARIELAEGPRPAYATAPPAQRDRTRTGGAFLGIVADLRGGDGIRLSDVLPDGAGSRAGLTAGDVIVRFAGRSVEDFETLRRLIDERRAGDRVEIVYLRLGEDRTALATLGARP